MTIKNFYYKNNRLQQLKGFYYTVQKRTLAKAAEHLGVSPSAISQQISTLERDLGVKLFHKSGREKALTADGKLFYSYAIDIVQKIDSVYERFLEDNQDRKKTLDISANHMSLLYLLPAFVTIFKDLYPHVNIMLRNVPKEEGMSLLLDGKTDMCFYPLIDIPDECNFIPLAKYNPVLIVPRNHPLVFYKGELTLEEVAKYDLIRIDPHLITLPLFEELAHTYKLGSKIKFQNGDWEILKKLVRAKAGIALISSLCLDADDDTIVGLSLAQYFPSLKYGISLKKGINPLEPVENFIKIVQDNMKDEDNNLSE